MPYVYSRPFLKTFLGPMSKPGPTSVLDSRVVCNHETFFQFSQYPTKLLAKRQVHKNKNAASKWISPHCDLFRFLSTLSNKRDLTFLYNGRDLAVIFNVQVYPRE